MCASGIAGVDAAHRHWSCSVDDASVLQKKNATRSLAKMILSGNGMMMNWWHGLWWWLE
jgi:hypothetical protein